MTPTLSSSFPSHSKQFSDGKIDQFSNCLLKIKSWSRLPFFFFPLHGWLQSARLPCPFRYLESVFGSGFVCQAGNTDGVSVVVAVSWEHSKGQCWRPAFACFHLIPMVVLAQNAPWQSSVCCARWRMLGSRWVEGSGCLPCKNSVRPFFWIQPSETRRDLGLCCNPFFPPLPLNF